jgi:hypothetical protein
MISSSFPRAAAAGAARRRGVPSRNDEDWSEVDRNPMNRSVRLARVDRELIAACGRCGLVFFVDSYDSNPRVYDARVERGVHRGCGGPVRLGRWRR